MTQPKLVLISGPIGSGKTTAASRLTTVLKAQGVTAAALDMDEFVEMVAGSDWSRITREDRDFACDVAGNVARELLASGFSFIAIAGSTLSGWEWEAVLSKVALPAERLFVRLDVSLAESVRRAQQDPARVLTKDPDFVARLYERIDRDSLAPADLEIDTDGLDIDAVVSLIMARTERP